MALALATMTLLSACSPAGERVASTAATDTPAAAPGGAPEADGAPRGDATSEPGDPSEAAPTTGREPETVLPTPAGPEQQAGNVPLIEPSGPFGVDTITLRGDGRSTELDVWVADEPDLRARGLMERETVPDGAGMLFTYDEPDTRTFWMRNTLIPLSIAFFDGDGAVVGILDMEPCRQLPCERYGPDQPFRYALEVPQGWFAATGVDGTWRLDTGTLPPSAT